MAGSGVYYRFNSSKDWHNTAGYYDDGQGHQTSTLLPNDYNDNVIVPKSILIDTADAIRLKRDGTTAIEVDLMNDGTAYPHSNNFIEPVDFATEIGNLVMGSSLTDIQNIATTGNYSSTTRRLEWKGDIRKIAFIAYICNNAYSGSTFHDGYIFIPSMLSQDFTHGQNIYIPLIKIRFSGASGNTYATIYRSGANNFNAAVLKTQLITSYGAADTTSYTATIFESSGQNPTTGYNGNGLWIRSGISV